MQLVGYGVFRGVRTGVKNDRSYMLLELGSEDYRSLTVFVPDELRPKVQSFSGGQAVGVEITAESVFGRGIQMTLKDIQLKK